MGSIPLFTILTAVTLTTIVTLQWKAINDASLPTHSCHTTDDYGPCLRPSISLENDNDNGNDGESEDDGTIGLALELHIYDRVTEDSNHGNDDGRRGGGGQYGYRWRVVSTCQSNNTNTNSSSSSSDLRFHLSKDQQRKRDEEDGTNTKSGNETRASFSSLLSSWFSSSSPSSFSSLSSLGDYQFGKDGSCQLVFPEFSRMREEEDGDDSSDRNGGRRMSKEVLKGKFVLRRTTNEHQNGNGSGRLGKVVAETVFDITRRIKKKQPQPKLQSKQSNNNHHNNELPAVVYVPYVKYGRQPIVLRLVADTQSYPLRAPFRRDGYRMVPSYHTKLTYPPPFFVDDVALRRSAQIELGPPPPPPPNTTNNNSTNTTATARPPFSFRIKLKIISPQRHVVQRQMILAMDTAETILGSASSAGNDDILDEIRYLISDENIYRFIITQIITFLHIWLDYMAFREEVRFYVGRGKNKNKPEDETPGLSLSTVSTRLLCDTIILLYLADSGRTSWIVLLSVGSSIPLGLWKIKRVLRLRIVPQWPFLVWRDATKCSRVEARAIDYDRIARVYMGLVLYPAVIGFGLYSLSFQDDGVVVGGGGAVSSATTAAAEGLGSGGVSWGISEWYSWSISIAADIVYTFGFITLCPQLYINYRLKSVAHLPWKVFVYKLFNTFVDDAFAFLMRSPLKYRLMTLRDDVVFCGFLVQAWIYRVDRSRVNEFGYAYGEEEKDNKEEGSEGDERIGGRNDDGGNSSGTVAGRRATDSSSVIPVVVDGVRSDETKKDR